MLGLNRLDVVRQGIMEKFMANRLE